MLSSRSILFLFSSLFSVCAEWPYWSQRWVFGPNNIFHSISFLSGLLISVWGIALWGAVRALNAASAFSFTRTLTCPGTQHRSMIILSSSALRISSLVSTKIGEKESDLSAKRALLESEKIVNQLPSMVPFKLSCTAAFIAYSSAVNIEASGKSATTGGVRKHCCKAHAFGGLRAICINMHRRMPLLVCQENGSHFFVE